MYQLGQDLRLGQFQYACPSVPPRSCLRFISPLGTRWDLPVASYTEISATPSSPAISTKFNTLSTARSNISRFFLNRLSRPLSDFAAAAVAAAVDFAAAPEPDHCALCAGLGGKSTIATCLGGTHRLATSEPVGLADLAAPDPRAEVLVLPGSGVVRSSYIRSTREEKVNTRWSKMSRGRNMGSNIARSQERFCGRAWNDGSIMVPRRAAKLTTGNEIIEAEVVCRHWPSFRLAPRSPAVSLQPTETYGKVRSDWTYHTS